MREMSSAYGEWLTPVLDEEQWREARKTTMHHRIAGTIKSSKVSRSTAKTLSTDSINSSSLRTQSPGTVADSPLHGILHNAPADAGTMQGISRLGSPDTSRNGSDGVTRLLEDGSVMSGGRNRDSRGCDASPRRVQVQLAPLEVQLAPREFILAELPAYPHAGDNRERPIGAARSSIEKVLMGDGSSQWPIEIHTEIAASADSIGAGAAMRPTDRATGIFWL